MSKSATMGAAVALLGMMNRDSSKGLDKVSATEKEMQALEKSIREWRDDEQEAEETLRFMQLAWERIVELKLRLHEAKAQADAATEATTALNDAVRTLVDELALAGIEAPPEPNPGWVLDAVRTLRMRSAAYERQMASTKEQEVLVMDLRDKLEQLRQLIGNDAYRQNHPRTPIEVREVRDE